MTQTVKLPNGDTLQFPDGIGDDEIAKAISDNYPQFAPKAASTPKVLGGLPVDQPIPAPARASTLAGLPVQADDAPASADVPVSPAGDVPDPNAAAPQQNQFAASRLSRAEYEKELRVMKPNAPQGLIDAAMAQYDQQKAAQLKAAAAQRQAGPMKPILSPEQFFDERLNRRLNQHTAEVNDPEDTHDGTGIVPQLPGRQDDPSIDYSTKHSAGQPADDSLLSDASSYLGRSTTSGLYGLAGASAKLLDAINPFTLSEQDAAILYKNDPAHLKQMQDESIAMGLSRFARAMQTDGTEEMDKISAGAKQRFNGLEYATLDPNKTAFSSPVKVIGDAIRSLPSSLAMGAAAYLTRGASLRAEEAALAAGFSAQAAKAAGVEAGAKMMGTLGASSEGAIGYAQQALQTEEETGKLPMEKLRQSPKFQQLLTQGYTPETARAKIIADTSEHAGQIAGLVDAVTNKFGGEVLGRIISEGGPFMRRMLSGAADEGATEFVQSAGEQMGGNFATQQNADPNQSTWDGVGEAAVAGLAVGGLMGGTTAAVAGHHAHAPFDDGSAAAAAARQAALNKWNTSGLSPAAKPGIDGRTEPSWSSVANPGAGAPPAGPAGRVEPTIADITSATSVDDAIAAASAVANSTTPHATAADIDALEEQAGLTAGNLAAENQAASSAPAAGAGAEPTHDDVMGAMQERAAEAAASRAPAIAEDPADWHPFPAEMRSMGVPRAQMPQILAEHRGAMVNFLSARGIMHEHVEVAPESLRPTQREFSLSKVEKATDFEGGNRSILISSDNYVLDGHHQWMAAALKGEPVQAIRLNAPIKELVKTIHQFPSATVDTSSAGATPADPGRPLNAYEKAQERIRQQEEVVRQAIEKQAAHRAGQAPQEPGSSIPTAAERAPAAPLPPPKPTAGQRSRERVQRENPFLAFLGEHGVHIDERSDTGGQKGRAGVVMVPGYGQLYRKKGQRLDELAQLAHERGFLTDQDMADPTDNGGTRKLAEMIQRAAHSKEAIREAGLLEAAAPTADDRMFEEAHARGIDTTGKTADEVYTELVAHDQQAEGRRETSGAETHDEQDAVDHYESQVDPQELADADIPFDLNDERLAPTNNLTDEQIDALFGLQKAAGPRADRGETEGHAAEHSREGAAPAGEQGEEKGGVDSAVKPADVVDDDGDMPGAKYAEFDDDAHIRYGQDAKGNLILQSIHSSADVRGRAMLEWLNSHYQRPVKVYEATHDAAEFWEKMQREGLISSWTEKPFKSKTTEVTQGENLLSSYTPGEVVAREDAAAAREKATQAERDKLEAQRKKAQAEKEARARSDATVDDFQLGQDPIQQLSGQRGMFDEPAPKQAEKAAPAAEDIDDGSDIPHAFYAQVTVPHRVYSDDGKTSAMHDVPADVALESVREDISSLEAMLKCMGA